MSTKPKKLASAATKTFYKLLGNSLIANVTNMTVWTALTYFVYLETRSVFATATIAGIYLVMTALSGFWFGSLVDHYKKKIVMQFSGLATLSIYVITLAIYFLTPHEAFKDPTNPMLWIFATLVLFGVILSNIRTIALPTLITILIPEDKRDKANGLVGSTTGTSFLVVSVISGLLIGFGGMHWVLIMAIGLIIASILHLATITIPEEEIIHLKDQPRKVDISGTLKVVLAVPGLIALILFSTFNNFLGGVFMALMDAYGLSLVSVQVWGIIWGVVSVAFIIGGLMIAKTGLGKNPLRTLFMGNMAMWIVACVFTIQPSVILLVAGMFMYLILIPYIEASEQTILQKVVPHERQGRVFGFAQSIEQMASPMTAFLIGPIAQFIFIPFMTDGPGVDLIGGWFGTGPARGLALVFIATGLVGIVVTLIAMSTKYYRQLSDHYLSS